MGRRTPALFALLAILSISDATPLTAGSDPNTGSVHLLFPRRTAVALPIDVQAVAEDNCESAGTPRPLGQCRLVVPGVGSTIKGAILQSPPSSEPHRIVQWQVTEMAFAGDAVATSCGPWDLSLRLDSTGPQPVSSMILKPAAEGRERGLAAGILETNFRLYLTHQRTGQVADYPPLGLGLSFGGTWGLNTSRDPATLSFQFAPKEYCDQLALLEGDEFWEQYLVGDCRCPEFKEDGGPSM